MKIRMLATVVMATAFSVFADELPVNWQKSLEATAPGAALVNGWGLNNPQKFKDAGTGEVTEVEGVKYFQMVTTGRDSSFFFKQQFPAQAGDVLELEITVQGTGHLVVGYWSYQPNMSFFIPSNYKIDYIIPKNGEKKTWTIRKVLADGKKGEKLGRITLTIGAGGKSTFNIYDFKARLIKANAEPKATEKK